MPKKAEKPEKVQEEGQDEPMAAAPPPPKASFPWLMLFFVAIPFDIIEFFIPILMPAFGLIMGFWQKMYAPGTDPFASFLIAKIADVISLGILPSNTAIVVFAFAKKKITEKKAAIQKLSKTKLGQYATSKFSQQSA